MTTSTEIGEAAEAHNASPSSFVGPVLLGKPTTITLYSPSQLNYSPLIPSLIDMTNTAFSTVQSRNGTLPASVKRFVNPDQFLQQFGNASNTFIYIMTWAKNDQPRVIATAGASRYENRNTDKPDSALGDIELAFTRRWLPERITQQGTAAEVWSLTFLAVDVQFHGRGLAVLLTGLVDAEVKRRFVEAHRRHGDEGKQEVWMILTSRKDSNHTFYQKRGYQDDFERTFEAGFLESERGFSVVDMSKKLAT